MIAAHDVRQALLDALACQRQAGIKWRYWRMLPAIGTKDVPAQMGRRRPMTLAALLISSLAVAITVGFIALV